MHNDLPALAAKIGERLSISSEYVVTQPAELRVLRDMSEDELGDFAKSHGWRIIRRLGGQQIEFYNDASARAVAGIADPAGTSRQLHRVNAIRYSNAGQRRLVSLPSGAFQMEAAKIYFIIFGLLTIAGGIVGYVKAGSVVSIIAGAITGVLLVVAAFLLPEHRVAGLATALIISVLLAGQFVPKFFRTGRVMPAGVMSVLSVIGIIAAIIAWVRK